MLLSAKILIYSFSSKKIRTFFALPHSYPNITSLHVCPPKDHAVSAVIDVIALKVNVVQAAQSTFLCAVSVLHPPGQCLADREECLADREECLAD